MKRAETKLYEPSPLEILCEEMYQRRKREKGVTESAAPVPSVRIDETTAAKSFVGYPGHCKTCGASLQTSKSKKSKSKEAAEPDLTADMKTRGWVSVPVSDSRVRHTTSENKRLDAIKASLYESFVLAGLEPEAAKIAAGLEESYIGDVKVSDILKG